MLITITCYCPEIVSLPGPCTIQINSVQLLSIGCPMWKPIHAFASNLRGLTMLMLEVGLHLKVHSHFHQVFFLTLLRPGARVFKSPLPGAEMITFLAPASMCPAALVFHKSILILIRLDSLSKEFANQPCANYRKLYTEWPALASWYPRLYSS